MIPSMQLRLTSLYPPSTLTFLAALMFIFFDRTNFATSLSLGIVVGLLFVTVLLLLYLEGEGTVSGEESTYTRLYAACIRWLRMLWKGEQKEEDVATGVAKWGKLWRELRLRRKFSATSSEETMTELPTATHSSQHS